MKTIRESYIISEEGKIYKDLGHRVVELKSCINSWGYLVFATYIRGEKMMHKVHREVAKAFVPNPNNYPQVNHKDGDKLNNHYLNLEWCTNQMNQRHRVDAGLMKKKRWSKLTDTQRKDIIDDYNLTGHGSCRLAKRHGVGINAVYRVIRASISSNR